jgi:hypothetical protein
VITINHTHAKGTVVNGTSSGDGTNLVIKAVGDGWRFSRNLDAWYLPRSRDRHADQPRITRLTDALREAGYTVEVSVDDTRRTQTEIEDDREARAAGRVERYTDLADRRRAEGAARLDHVRERRDHFPLGQPVMDQRDANRRAKLNRSEDIGREHLAAANRWQQRADSAETTQRYRHNPRVITRRIQRLDAEMQRWIRHVDSANSDGGGPADDYITRAHQEIARLHDEITHWSVELGALQQAGLWRPWKPEHFQPGDEARILDTWYPVLRVNRKTVTISPLIFGGQRRYNEHGKDVWTDTMPYDKVYGRRRDRTNLHTPPPPADATCSLPATSAPDSELCPHPPVARVTIRHDGTACGCSGACMNDSDSTEATTVEPWTEVVLYCAEHEAQHQPREGGEQVSAATYEALA